MHAHGEVAERPRTKPSYRTEVKDASALFLNIGDDESWRALGSPYRMRLFELVRRMGPCTITELAPLAATNPVNLYYHVHTLKRAGLIVPSGRRSGVARRAPVIYKAPHDQVIIEFDPENEVHRERLGSIRRNWLRESHEELEVSGRRHAEGKANRFIVDLRWELLCKEELDEIASLFDQINAILNRSHKSPPKSDEDAALVHIGLHMVETLGTALPAPRVDTKPRARKIPISERRLIG